MSESREATPPPSSVVIDMTSRVESDSSELDQSGSKFHRCFDEGCDPLIGILNETASRKACCPLRSYLYLTPQNEEFKAALTPFGRRMMAVGDHYQVDIHRHWLQKPPTSHEKIVAFLREYFRRPRTIFKDDDRVEWLFAECSICSAPCRFVRRPPCCRKSVCQICWSSYLKTGSTIYDGIKPSSYNLVCYGCQKLVPYSQAIVSTEPSQLTMLRHDRTELLAHCPVCLNEVKQKPSFKQMKNNNKFVPVTCDRCTNTFCARCGADSHPKHSCYEVKHDAGLALWMKEQHPNHSDFQNCRFCPNCRTPISHNGGCPWLKCICGTEFCFACGKAKQKWNGWHRQRIVRCVPFVTCPRMWKSQAKRVVAQIIFSLFFITVLGPLIIAFLPIILIIFLLVLAVYVRLPSNIVHPAR